MSTRRPLAMLQATPSFARSRPDDAGLLAGPQTITVQDTLTLNSSSLPTTPSGVDEVPMDDATASDNTGE